MTKAMRLMPAPGRADHSDFWRPRLFLDLLPAALPAGLFRITTRTRAPTYCTVRFTFQAEWAAPVIAYLDRLGPCSYGKIVNLPRATSKIELEIEPASDAQVLANVEIERVAFHQLLWDYRRWLRGMSDPRNVLRKARQVLSGRHSLAFSDRRPGPVDEQAIYQAWQAAFESVAERARIEDALRAVACDPARLLLVLVASNATREAGRSAPSLNTYNREFAPVAIEAGGEPLPYKVRQCVEEAGGRIVRSDDGHVPLHLILAEAERVGASAFAYLEGDGYWSELSPKVFGIEMLHHPDCVAVTADSDYVTGAHVRSRPWFRPAWSPRYQSTADYVRGAIAFRAGQQLAQLCGRDADASSSRSLVARLIDNADTRGRVRHVPRVLLHARSMPAPAQRGALPAPSVATGTLPLVSVIMPTKDNPRLLKAAALSVLGCSLELVELVIIDNGAASAEQHAQLDRLSRDPRVRILQDARPFNFAALMNAGRKACRGEILVLLNDDIRAEREDWLDALAQVAMQPDVGCVGALLLYPSGRIQHGGIVLGLLGVAGHAFRHMLPSGARAAERLSAIHEVSAVTGACLAVRAKVFDEVGGLDERLPVTLNDVDLCLRVRAKGYRNLMAPHVRLVHEESATRGLDAAPDQATRLQRETSHFLATWGTSVLTDPYYSPHLSLTREDHSLRDI
ncbi:MAG: glycosyltransferase family 2 protein [Bacteroidota bacterium]